jgi:hypothetical protein
MTKLITSQFQIVWSVFLEFPPLEATTNIVEITNVLENKKVLQPSMDRTLRSWIDGASIEEGFSISSKSFTINGLAVSEMRTYAQKKQKDKKYHRSFFDEIVLKQGNRNLLLDYTFEIICLIPNIIVIDVKTQPFKTDLFVDDFKRLAHLPKSDSKSNLYLYVKRLCRFIVDWGKSDPFSQRQETENNFSISVVPTIIIDFDNEKQLKQFREHQKKEIYGILTRAPHWESTVLSRVEEVVSKNLTPFENDILLIDKTGILIADRITEYLEHYHEWYFSVIKLMEVAYAHGMVLDTTIKEGGKQKKIFKDIVEATCDNIIHPIRITKSSHLREIWEKSLVKEFSLITKYEYVKEQNNKEETYLDMKEPKNNNQLKGSRDQVLKIITSIILLSFALAGFIWLSWPRAFLWLIFLIVAYPVALAFTTAKQSMSNKSLTEIYKKGLLQVPVLGKFFGRKLIP